MYLYKCIYNENKNYVSTTKSELKAQYNNH